MSVVEFKKDTIYRQLRSSIINGTYPCEHKFPRELDFSRKLGVGKVTLRMALEKLEAEGLVARLPSRGTFVTYDESHGTEAGRILLLSEQVGGMENPYLYILPGVLERAADALRATTICPIEYLLSMSAFEQRDMVRKNNISGVVLLTGHFTGSEPLIGALKNMDVPVVIAHAKGMDREITGFATIRIDQCAAWRTAIQHLAAQGHERVATLICDCVGDNIRDYSEAEHLNLLSNFGMKADRELIIRADYDKQKVYCAINEFAKKSGFMPSAVLCFSDFMAIYLYDTLKEMRIRIPEDVAVMGYCGYPGSALLSPPLSTVDFQYTKIGAASFDLLASSGEWFDPSAEVVAPEIFVEYVLRERKSTSAIK